LIQEKIQVIKENIHNCAIKCSRDPNGIKLLAVTKTHPVSVINEAIQSGIEYIAESKVQEAEGKVSFIKCKEFHFIGHLQSNKINKLLALNPCLIHSIEKFSTAEKLNEAVKQQNKIQEILIEVNTSGEPSKHGVKPDECTKLIEMIDKLENIKVMGLMTIGVLSNDEKVIRKCFSTLRELFEAVKTKNYTRTKMKYLSMGMSDDYMIAIEEGSNLLRIGSGIFGIRNKR